MTAWPDLASDRDGGTVIACSDEFFAAAARLIQRAAPVSCKGTFDEHGQWMDGWETRRHRAPDTDWVIVRLGQPAIIREVVIDTAFFDGNQPERAGLDGAYLPGNPGVDEVRGAHWSPVVEMTPLQPDHAHVLAVDSATVVTHVRLRIDPDGGVARLRVHGEVILDPRILDGLSHDLACAALGGVVEQCSDMHFGDRRNLVAPGEARTMGEGWETRRRRGPGADWAIVRLAAEAAVGRVTVDTRQFRGNAPRSCDLEVSLDRQSWTPVADGVRLQPDQVHDVGLAAPADARWVRLTVHPDGGVARLRVLGSPTRAGRRDLALRWLNALPAGALQAVLLTACGSPRWAAQLAAGRPFARDLIDVARGAWDGLAEADWEQALAAHPRIGDRPPAGSQEQREQSAADAASAEVLEQIAAGNRAYEQRFGRTYVVRAAGRSAAEMLAVLQNRMTNSDDAELRAAADQQWEITARRLAIMLQGSGS